MPKTVPLSKALKTHDGEVMKLELRDITAADVVEMKTSPYQVIRREGDEVELIVKYDVMMKYLSRLTGIDDLLLGALKASDFQSACNVVGQLWNDVGE